MILSPQSPTSPVFHPLQFKRYKIYTQNRHRHQKLGLFRTDPSRILSTEYRVVAIVQPEDFGAFMGMVEGGPFVITDGNYRSLSDLSDEFECAELSAACDDFSRSRLSALEFDSPGIVSALLLRIAALEKRQQTLELSLVSEQTKVSALETRTRVLERSVSGLSADRGLLFAEQAYRRGCEYLFGSVGFGDGARLRRHLGLQCLKRAADAGHGDAQYQYGRCLLKGIWSEVDWVGGAEYLRQSAKQGNSFGADSFGDCLETGCGVVKDLNRAAEFYRLSAEQGDAFGQCNFG